MRCPITQQPFELQVLKKSVKKYNNTQTKIVEEGILWAGDLCYPVIKGVPRLLVETIIDYEDFLMQHINNFTTVKAKIMQQYETIITAAMKKNKRTKQSFAQEWSLFNYDKDTTWNADKPAMFSRFLKETDETIESIKGKTILDAGCGNGLLNNLIANAGAKVLGFDFSLSIEKAFEKILTPMHGLCKPMCSFRL